MPRIRTAVWFWLAVTVFTNPAAAEIPQNVETFTLDNGMEAVVITDRRAPVVTHMVWYRVGSADEPPGKSGIAHYLEHLMFKGTEEIPVGRFSEIVAENGGQDNAFTSFDYTGYFQRIAKDRLGLVMEMEADRMVNLVISEDAWQAERDVVLEERNQRVENDPGALLREQQQAAIFRNHPYGRPIIGWRHEIEALTRDDALAFYRDYYAPNNAILIVAGDVGADEVRALAETHYGPIPPSDAVGPRVRPQEPPQRSHRRVVLEDERVRQPYVTRSYMAPTARPGGLQQAAALSVLAQILTTPITGVLPQKLELGDKVALNSGAFYSPTSYDPDTFGLFIVPVPGIGLEEAEAHLDRAIDAFLAEGVDPAALERVKTRLRASEIYALDDQSGRARRYGQALTAGLTVADVAAWPDALQAVTAEDVMAQARALFGTSAYVTGWLARPATPSQEVSQ